MVPSSAHSALEVVVDWAPCSGFRSPCCTQHNASICSWRTIWLQVSSISLGYMLRCCLFQCESVSRRYHGLWIQWVCVSLVVGWGTWCRWYLPCSSKDRADVLKEDREMSLTEGWQVCWRRSLAGSCSPEFLGLIEFCCSQWSSHLGCCGFQVVNNA